jgi:hypothetical protein
MSGPVLRRFVPGLECRATVRPALVPDALLGGLLRVPACRGRMEQPGCETVPSPVRGGFTGRAASKIAEFGDGGLDRCPGAVCDAVGLVEDSGDSAGRDARSAGDIN